MTNPLLSGPFDLPRRDRLTPEPGETIILRSKTGTTELAHGKALTWGETRFSKDKYYRLRTQSEECTIKMEAVSADLRDPFVVEVRYYVLVTDPQRFFHSTDPGKNPFPSVASEIRSHIRELAGKTEPKDWRLLRKSLLEDFALSEHFSYLQVVFTDAEVTLADAALSRLTEEKAVDDEITHLRLRDRVDEATEALRLKQIQRVEANRIIVLKKLQTDYGLDDLDPFMMRVLALAEGATPSDINEIRSILRNERFDDLNRFGAWVQTLHDHDMLDNEVFAFLKDYAKQVAQQRGVGRAQALNKTSPPKPLEQGSPGDFDDEQANVLLADTVEDEDNQTESSSQARANLGDETSDH